MRKLTGRGVLLLLIAFFGVIVAVDSGFIALAVATYRGEDEQRPYLQGVEFNRTLERRAEQRELGWRAEVRLIRAPSGAAQVDVTLRGRDGGPEQVKALNAELRHPVDEGRDRSLRLASVGAGHYVGEVKGVAPGAWDVVVSTPPGDAPFEASTRLWLH